MDDETQMPTVGTVLFYLPDKRYGYVRVAGTREEFYFREKNLTYQGVKSGDMIRFVLKRTGQGYIADRIELAGLT